jgi:hypothetical protein
MTEEQQRIAIAEACGWKQCQHCAEHGLKTWRYPTDDGCTDALPYYTRDLNAMHEAVRKLTDSQRTKFRQNLTKVWTTRYNATHGLFPPHDDSVNASAKQRAEAFLRTLNLWKI